MASFDPTRILLTVGDHEFDGWNSARALPQDPSADYGKTLLIHLFSGEAEPFTVGHRNPQGLHIDSAERVWSTEHGPDGGDELNLLSSGRNYGWPLTTDGTDYGSYDWPSIAQVAGGGHEFQPPVFAWVPSIGVSSLISVTSSRFAKWRDDLLVGSLADRSLHRVRIRQGGPRYVERMPLDIRIRDMVEGAEGRLYIWGDSGVVASVTPSISAASGAAVFARCVGCHREDGGGIGPSLRGIYRRPVAGAPGFVYSRALESLGGRWSERRLITFLRDPNGIAPGTTMAFAGIKDSTELAVLVEYLKQLR